MTTDADTLAKFLADAVDDGTISLALADRSQRSTRRPARQPNRGRPMMRAACAHCGEPYRCDADDDGPDAYLCADCADYAVMGAPCADCGETPGRRPCRDVDSLRHYRALELERRAH